MSTTPRAVAAAACGRRLFPRVRALLGAAALCLSALLPLAGAAAQTTDSAPKGGLFFKTSKPGSYYEAPLVDTDVTLAVTGTILRATVRQHFVNPSSAWLEGVYVFPLPEQAAVDHLVMEIGERHVVGQIKERQEAKAVYEQAAANGQHASLVESERPNIFTTSVANIGPGEAITVEIQYQDSVHIDAGVYSLRFPMVVGPRYIPGGPIAQVSADPDRPAPETGTGWAANTDRVPDASRITPPVLQPGQGKINPVRIAIDFAPGFATGRVTSLYHPVITAAKDGDTSRITLADGDVPADRDFVLEWTPKPASAPTASLFAEQRGPDVYLFAMMTPAARDAATKPRLPRDVVFVIDTSGSMGGTSIVQAKRALSLALDRLTADDRFNVIEFNSVTSSLFQQVQPWDADTLRQAQAFVAGLVATGGTEMRPALQQALAGTTPAGRLKQVVFLTDAAVGNEAEMFEDIARQLGDQRLFTIGIGSAPNSYFMRKAAELGRGSFTYIGDVAEVGERMNELLRKLEEPAVTDIGVRWPEAVASTAEMFPATVPDLYEGQPVTFSARLPNATLGQLSGLLAIEGRDGETVWRQGLDLVHAQAGAGVAAVWAQAKLSAIEDRQWRGGDADSVRRAAIQHALAYELVSPYTSLVAVDEEKVRPADERLDTAAVATNLPQGWEYDKVFGGDSAGGGDAVPRPEPGKLMREINFTGTPLDGLSLPKTATPAPLHLLIGALLLALAAASLGARAAARARGVGLIASMVMGAGAQPASAGRRARLCRWAGALLAALALWQIGSGLWIPAKAWLAQILIARAWDEAMASGRPAPPWPWADTTPVARLAVPRLGVDQIVLAHATGRTLAFGPGHLDGSPAPGEPGLAIVSGHRDTSFRFLADLTAGDAIRIQRADGVWLDYRVAATDILDERSSRLPRIVNGPARLALTTCYPFDAISPGGPLRYVVWADAR